MPIVDDALVRGELPSDLSRATLLNVIGVLVAGLGELSANCSTAAQHAVNAEAVIRLLEGRLVRARRRRA